MSDWRRDQDRSGGWRTVVRVRGVEDTGPFPGRHASRTEIAAETPIFHALTVGGWRSRQQEASARAGRHALAGRRASRPEPVEAGTIAGYGLDPIEQFCADPLTAPIPVQALAAAVPGVPSPVRTRLEGVRVPAGYRY